MLELIGSLHPVFIHFPLALLLAGGLFFLGASSIKPGTTANALRTTGSWNFCLGFGSLIPALITGWAAFQTVTHDTPSHVVMTLHRNWAIAAGAAFLWVTVYAWRNRDSAWPKGGLAWIALFLGLALLGVTGYLGGTLVYRHGLGVQSLPAREGEAHGHEGNSHGDALEHRKETKAPAPDDSTTKPPLKPHHHDATPHKH